MAQIALASDFGKQLAALEKNEGPLAVWLSDGHLSVGPYPSARYRFDFASERFLMAQSDGAQKTKESKIPSPVLAGGSRRTGDYAFVLQGTTHSYVNLRQLLSGGLLLMEALHPGMLEKLENHKPRSKRAVSRRKEALYDDQNLVAKFSEPLQPGWFYATNNSAAEVRRYLSLAAKFAGLGPGDYEVVA